jgi:hypothetical protein
MLFETHIWNQKTGNGNNGTLKDPCNYTLTVTLGESGDYGALANFCLR